MANSTTARKIYHTVVEDVIANVREAFLDEGVDEQVLQELKQLWESKLNQSKALDPVTPEQEQMIPTTIQFAHMSVPQQQTQQHQAHSVQHAIPMPLHIGTSGELSGAAAMAFNAQGGLFQQHLQALVNAGQTVTLQHTANGQYILQTIPQTQQHQVALTGGQQMVSLPQHAIVQATQATTQQVHGIPQLDGTNDTSSSEDEDYDNDDNDDNEDEKEDDQEEQGEEEEPLNSEDDVSEEDPSELFDTDNVVVCQFEKVSRNKNKWKFTLKDGIMNLNGRDYVFQKGSGEADW
ncbi:hypothetical protein CHS0354_023072 [Potamilus streckersoni]|uniref:Transcription initiation factor IIA subunit 1 n=1 Tax=Potamilus streckersoni TaxID=2493646 RepID=A0AAE0RW62_9BIVA|nr:hypothetical protein CHS0354_023072 [Potamilus streckersoni]